MLKLKKVYTIFVLAYLTQLRTTHTRGGAATSGGWRWLYFVQTLWCLRTSGGWTYIQNRKKHFNYHKLWYLYFGIWNFVFKVCNTALIMPVFFVLSFFSVFVFWFKIIYPFKIGNYVLYILVVTFTCLTVKVLNKCKYIWYLNILLD